MIYKKWIVKPDPPADYLLNFPGLNAVLQKLLFVRGISEMEDARFFLQPDYEQVPDPYLFQDMLTVVERIWDAIHNQEKIIIHGDYDADGVTSSAIMYKTLKALGAKVDVFIPHREADGYGMNLKNIKKFIQEKYDLLITVDCGITNIEEVKYAELNGLEVIITDHHEPLEILPSALAIINPKKKDDNYSFKYLCGAGVAYKVASALLKTSQAQKVDFSAWGGNEGYLKWLLDLVAIGTTADVMPLIGENRVYVKYGLKVLAKTRRLGLQQLAEVAGIDLTKEDPFTIGFQIAPRLNAAGRMDHAQLAFDLLTTDDAEQAYLLARQLQETNTGRQRATDVALTKAREQVLAQNGQKIFFVYDPEIPAGIIGLIAGRINDEFYRPTIVMTNNGDQIVGSGRSIDCFDITQALFKSQRLLSRYGGHPQACGFTLQNEKVLEEFKSDMLAQAAEKITDPDLVPVIEIDAVLKASEMQIDLVKQLEKLSPYGEGNSKPRFLIAGLNITAIDRLGNGEKHLRIMAKADDSYLIYKFMAFGAGDVWGGYVNVGDKIDVVVELGLNFWNGYENVEARIIDLKK